MSLSKKEEVVRYILERTGNIPKTKLVKLLFLADRKFSKENEGNSNITGFRYIRYFYGPYTSEIEDVIGSLSIKGLIRYFRHITLSGNEAYLIGKSDKEVSFKHLNEDEKKALDEIVENFGNKSLSEILDEVYSFDEVEKAGFGEEITI
ncbi:Panacea domain-containing protein [Hippea alviniae]|uniref:Panacea domain-containing protein n=1 Tax=Hippea alviniae TaxID=1279027 RepID=UPI0003B41CA1|nr:Panacea domain-containing protein [Hippea alviniae]